MGAIENSGGRQRLGKIIREFSTTLRKGAIHAIEDWQEHVRKVRTTLPPMSVKVLPVAEASWQSEPAARIRIEALEEMEFIRVGQFKIDVIPNYDLIGFIHPQLAIQAQVTRSQEGMVLELSSYFNDGSECICMDKATRPGMPSAPWVTSFRLPEVAPTQLIQEFLKCRPDKPLMPIMVDGFASRIEADFHRIQCWRAERGGFSTEEFRIMKNLGGEPEAIEQAEMLRHDAAQRWLCNWLKLQNNLPFQLGDVLDQLVIVYDEMTPGLVANAWWCGTGDFGVRADAFEGADPISILRKTNQERGEPLHLVCQKPAPFAADFYLPQKDNPPAENESRLAQVIKKGLANHDLRHAVVELVDYELKSDTDAKCVCAALASLKKDKTLNFAKQAQALARFFGHVPDRCCEAYSRLRKEGVPILIALFEDMRSLEDSAASQAAMLMLKIMARFETPEGTAKVIEVAKAGFGVDKPAWRGIFNEYTSNHSEAKRLFEALSNPLPEESIAHALLLAANTILIDGGNIPHPFNHSVGLQLLLKWISDVDPNQVDRAYAATVAIPFLYSETHDALLKAAALHTDQNVRMEAAWAAAKLGIEEGLQQLTAYCLHWSSSSVAQQYLRELSREDLIPASSREPSFVALAEMCHWLAHPNEFGRAPDELEIVDHRKLTWPTDRFEKPFWIIRYRFRANPGEINQETQEEDCGVGLVGSITFCLFSTNLVSRPPEEVYAIHCFWEMEQKELISEDAVEEGETAEHAGLLRQWRGEPLREPVVVRQVKLSPELKYPGQIVGLARATLEGMPGYAILDGDRSAWHASEKDSQTAKNTDRAEAESLLLKLHVGRQLLGL